MKWLAHLIRWLKINVTLGSNGLWLTDFRAVKSSNEFYDAPVAKNERPANHINGRQLDEEVACRYGNDMGRCHCLSNCLAMILPMINLSNVLLV